MKRCKALFVMVKNTGIKTQNITLSTNDKIALVSNLHTMLNAGIPILETVDSLLEDAKGNQQKVLTTMKSDLGQGQHLYFTFSKFPKIFDRVTVNILKASEEAGTLDESLNDLKDSIKKETEFRDKIRSALIYPVFILVLLIVVMLVILIVVVPKVSVVFSNLNVPLPVPTKIMLFLSNLLLTKTIYVVAVVGVIVGVLGYLYKTHRKAFVNALITLPLISKLAQEIDLTRFTRSLYLLLTAGIPITAAMELTEEVVVKKNIQLSIRHAKNVVLGGKKLSEGLKDNRKEIPPIMIKIVEAGERSGTLDKSMLDVSDYLDYQVSNTLKTVTALIEPLMLVFVGVLIGGMMMAVIAPMYSLIGSVTPH